MAQAWNAAGHRLTAIIAWQEMTLPTRQFVSQALAQHPDFPRWREKSGTGEAMLIFAEAATWADSIRHDPRFYDERRESPSPPITGFPDNARHLDWHYVNFERDGQRGSGKIDRQIMELTQLLRSTAKSEEIAWALPWLAHLVGDIHQPLHVGYGQDRGGNTVLIEDPLNAKNPFIKLHAYWDGLPGTSGLRGKKLRKKAGMLMENRPATGQKEVAHWLEESRALLGNAYPKNTGSVSPIIDSAYREQTKNRADRQITAAGQRLGSLLESIQHSRVSRGTR